MEISKSSMEKLLEEILKDNKQIGHLAFVCLLNDVVLFMNRTFRIYF